MANSFRVRLADALVDALQAVDFDTSPDIYRKWGQRAELDDGCSRVAVFPGSMQRTREDIGETIRTYQVAVVVQSRISANGIDEPRDDEDLTDGMDTLAEAVEEAIVANPRLAVDDERVMLEDTDISEHDQDDWHQRRIFTVLITASYQRIVSGV